MRWARRPPASKNAARRSPCGVCGERFGGRSGEANGAQGRNRTTDTLIFSQVLYRLSYLGNSREAISTKTR